MGRKLLHLLNGLITCAVVAALVLAGAYAGYALWDNQQVYDAAETSLSEMKEIRAALGMPSTVSALTELLEENRVARKAKAEATATPIPEMTAAPAESAPAAADTAPAPAAETTVSAAETGNNGTTTTVSDGTKGTTVTAAPEQKASSETAAPAPTATATEEPADDSMFGQLKAINEDITAWITMPGTAIDYPVLQGSTNYSYINTDVYGNFALAGSIFLDSRNKEDYTDIYSLLYGHNMAQHKMFSDVNLYKEETFFNENTLGMLLMPDGCHILESLSIIVVPASDSGMMNPENWTYLDGEGIYSQVQENALFTCEKGLEALRGLIDEGKTPRLVALSTCSDEFTDARTILLTLMDP